MSPRAASPLLAAALLLVQCQAEPAPLTPLRWEKVAGQGPNGALLELGAAGAFDEKATFTVQAFRDGPIVRLYYGGGDATGACPGINDSTWRIGLATSEDGVHFSRVPGDGPNGALLDVGPPGAFDARLTYRPFVLKDGPVYRMWFNGSAHPFNCPAGTLALDRRIGYAESADGVHWTRAPYDGPGEGGSVLPLGPPGAIDAQQVGYVWVVKDGAQYRMYYSANDADNTWRVALAVSTDARTWTKVPGPRPGGAVLDVGPEGAFDAFCAYQPSVVKEREQLWRMWYRGCEAAGPFGGPSRGTIGYAESNDGVTWLKIPQPGAGGATLERGGAGALDAAGITTPSVFRDERGWSMYYAGFDAAGQFLVGLARAAP